MILKTDCKHFPGNVPCHFNKTSGTKCDNCTHYAKRELRVLIIKLDALGDVLRTTALLPGLKKKYPESSITWLTRLRSAPLFNNNDFINELLTVENDAIPRLNAEKFDIVINTDADKTSAALASMAKASKKFGMLLDPEGYVKPADKNAEEWLEMTAFDQNKTKNKKTYQQIIYEICGLKFSGEKPILKLSDQETLWAEDFLKRHSLDGKNRVIGLNLGGGDRWKHKRWSEERIAEFSGLISSESSDRLILIGGRNESDLMKRLQSKLKHPFVSSGTDLTLRHLAGLISVCDVLITGDSLAMHMATALDVPSIVLFGPTSSSEIELYGTGEKIITPAECRVCYLPDCDKTPNCMELIKAETVFSALKKITAKNCF